MRLTGTRALALACTLAAFGCKGDMNSSTSEPGAVSFEQITPAQWARLGSERIFFGHQSVGGNVLEGIQKVLKENQDIQLKVVETADARKMKAASLYHANVGKNGDPASKLAAFREIVTALGDTGTVLLKYCYVDVALDTDANQLFAEYRRTVDAISKEHPGLKIVHVTLPLYRDAGTMRHVAAVARGKPSGRELNLVRHRYNELLRQTYGGKQAIFDLARVEATERDGSMALVRYKGERVPVLAAEWTYDGGHLNDEGAQRLAKAFLATLANLYPRESSGL